MLRFYGKSEVLSGLLKAAKFGQLVAPHSDATGLFDSVAIGRYKQQFVDEDLLDNNAIHLFVRREAEKIWPERDALVISIGTGSAPGGHFEGGIKKVVEAMETILTQTERTGDDFDQSHRATVDHGLLFRFNVAHGLAQTDLEGYKEVNSTADATETYSDNGETEQKMKACVERLLETQSEVTMTFGGFSKRLSVRILFDSINNIGRLVQMSQGNELLLSL